MYMTKNYSLYLQNVVEHKYDAIYANSSIKMNTPVK